MNPLPPHRTDTRRARAAAAGLLALACTWVPGCNGEGGDKQPIAGFQGTPQENGGGFGGGNIGGGGEQQGSGVIELNSLFAGAELGNGPPAVRDLAPTGIATPTTLIVAVFSESMEQLSIGEANFQLRAEDSLDGGGIFPDLDPGGPEPIPATVEFPAGTARRVALLKPAMGLAEGDYTVQLGPGITDLEGKTLEGDGGGEDSGGLFPGSGGAGTQTFSFTVNQDAQFNLISMFPLPGSKNAARDTDILLFFNRAVSAAAAETLQVTADGQPVQGKAKVDPDARILRFQPKSPLPFGAQVQVSAMGLPSAVAGQQPVTFSQSFTVTSVAAPSTIQLPGNAPLTVGELNFDGRVTSGNVKEFKAHVELTKANADSVTLLFFQAQTASLAEGQLPDTAARAFTREADGAKVKFKVNLAMGPDAAQFRDSTEFTPPMPVLVGAFATKNGENSPVGPIELVRLFVKVTKPTAQFGPPGDSAPFDLHTTLAKPAFYGTASELLTTLRVITDGADVPVLYEAVALSGPAGVTDFRNFFITRPGESTLSGFPVTAGPVFVPKVLDEVAFTDVVDNEVKKQGAKAGFLRQEGSIGGPLEEDAMEVLRVRVVRHHDLRALKGAEVRIEGFAAPGVPALQRTTGADGEAAFQPGELAAFGERLTVTAWKGGFDAFTLAGWQNPALRGTPFGVALILKKTAKDDPRLKVTRATHVGTAAPQLAFAGTAASSAQPVNGGACDACVADERFVLQPLDASEAARLDAEAARPLVVTALEHSGSLDLGTSTGSFAFQASEVRVPVGDEELEFSFPDQAGAAALIRAALPAADVTAAGIEEDPLEVTRARLVVHVPGLPGVLPLGLGRAQDGGGGVLDLPVPLPPSLMQDEVQGDPMHELLLHPPSALGGSSPPPEDLLEERSRLEVEAAEAGTTRLTRLRVDLDFVGATSTANASPQDLSGLLAVVPEVQASAGVHPPTFAVTGTGALDPDRTVYRVRLTQPGSARQWVVLLAGEALGAMTPLFAFPAAPITPFKNPGAFEVVVEALEFDRGAFDFDRFVFTDLEIHHRRLARSAATPVQTTSDP